MALTTRRAASNRAQRVNAMTGRNLNRNETASVKIKSKSFEAKHCDALFLKQTKYNKT